MSGMGFMVAAASLGRRHPDGDRDRRMGNDHSTHMMGDAPEMRRRRDSRGRYMEGETGPQMEYDGGSDARYWPEPHIPPYLNRPENRMPQMDQEPTQMRDRNVVNIRDYQDRRQIGFAPRMDDDDVDEEDREMRQYGRRYDPDRPQMHHGMMHEKRQRMGGAEGTDDEHLTREDAEKWVNSMQGADGKRGGRWTLKEIEQYAGNFGVKADEVIDFYAVLNALYTDYGKVARKYGFDRMEVWADLAKAFVHDKDAMPGKVKMYYECIARKGEE